VLVLREVLGLTAREVAEALDSTTASVNSALQRARRAVEERIPEPSQQATVRALGDERVRRVVGRFSDALERGDTDEILGALAEDASFSMPPYPSLYRGRAAIADSWLMPGGPPPRLRCLPTQANGQPAVAAYRLTPDGTRYLPLTLDVLTLRGAAIVEVTAFRTPELFAHFGLPDELAA
jgi:RNA polymerase sigma-70 factor (ECF subfamily)